MSVLLETSLGSLVVDLHVDECPDTCLNFLKLCKIKYYNFSLFSTVQQGFLAQTGDPKGTGGESIWRLLKGQAHSRFMRHELNPALKHGKRGTVSMAALGGGGKDSAGRQLVNGSQFFITLGDDLSYLDGQHTVFGQVAEGWDTLDKIDGAYVDQDGRPYQDIRIKHTIILYDPFDDPDGLAPLIPLASPEPTKEMLETGRLRDDEQIEDTEPPEVLEKRMKAQETKARQQTLEMIGDLPYADIKPPDHILFVCKLNPVTRDEDLELIFSRFGKINSCEVIRDAKTGDSLQYAFIEFDEKAACEEAYFKMQNVLIDDRRIFVDFTQSVSKMHSVWIAGRQAAMRGKNRADFGGFGGGVQKRQQYRQGDSASVASDGRQKYSLVSAEAPSHSSKQSDKSRDRSPGSKHRRDKSRDDKHRRDRSRDRKHSSHQSHRREHERDHGSHRRRERSPDERRRHRSRSPPSRR